MKKHSEKARAGEKRNGEINGGEVSFNGRDLCFQVMPKSFLVG